MLRFFRHIRKTLMEQNKVKTYFLYATGEILLVVIGILIALQINNWNEGRKAQVSMNSRINNIESELVDNIQLAEEAIRKHISILDTASLYLQDKLEISDPNEKASILLLVMDYQRYSTNLPWNGRAANKWSLQHAFAVH